MNKIDTNHGFYTCKVRMYSFISSKSDISALYCSSRREIQQSF